jgi:hypothetical protein
MRTGYDKTWRETKQDERQRIRTLFLELCIECCNWDVDMIETMEFCDWCYNMAGQPKPQYDMGIMMEDN